MSDDYRQAAPNAIQMESCEGCNLRCGFCGIRGITEKGPDGGSLPPDGKNHYMTEATAEVVAEQLLHLAWNPRIEWAMHGEPTLNPALPAMLSMMKAYRPDSPQMVTTNGIPMLENWEARVTELFTSGADTVAVDNYRPYRCEEAFDAVTIPGVAKGRYPEEGPAFSPHQRPRSGERRLILVKDLLEAQEGNHATVFNHAGSAYPKDPLAKGRCAKPFRELSVRWDGNVAICCDDWRGEFKVGNVLTEGIEAIWHDPAMYAARRMLYSGVRDAGPCEGCTHRSFRVGLLPDKTGQEELAAPSPEDYELIAQATADGTYAEPVLRRWEKIEIRSAT